MNNIDLDKHFSSLDLDDKQHRIRALSFLSALIAAGNTELLALSFKILQKRQFDKKAIYEIILQSYLFLGFPRMIEAAIVYSDIYTDSSKKSGSGFTAISPEESSSWFENGINLCRQVYGRNYARLKKRFVSISPEMFRWMVIEGYGKVLTRPGLTSVERELAEVAALIIDRRERQLVSHLIGSVNAGASFDLIKTVNKDIKPLGGDEVYHKTADLISRVEFKYDSSN